MAKEMSHDLEDETTEDVASKVLTTKRPAIQPSGAGQRSSDEAPLKSGVGKIDAGAHTKNPPPRPLPTPPRARARVPAPALPEPPNAENSEVNESEKTQVYRPNLSAPPVMHASARPTVRPAAGASPAASPVSIPKPPKVPEATPSAQSRVTGKKGPSAALAGTEEEDRTRVCPAAVIEGLLKKENVSSRDALRNAADDVTRVGEIPIEELVMAERQIASANAAVGHEDVTRSYSFNLNDTPSQVTSPGKRQQRLDLNYEPLVIIQPDRPRRKLRAAVLGLLLLGACSTFFGWRYRSTLERYSHDWKASFLRGISAATDNRSKPRNAAAVVASISVSISVSPADAALTIDGSRVPNPYMAQRPSDRISHDLSVEAPGHVSLHRQIQFDRDLTVVLALAPAPAAETTAPDVQKVPEPSSPATTLPPLGTKPTARVRTQKSAAVKSSPKTEATQSGQNTQSSCSPPYLIDAKGIKVFKPECL